MTTTDPTTAQSDADTERVSVDELRRLFLFEALDAPKLDWLAANGDIERREAGDMVHLEGEPATCFYVLLDGTVALLRRVQGDDVEMSRTSLAGSYGGAIQAYVEDLDQVYLNSMRAVTPARFFVLGAREFEHMMRKWYPMAVHLLAGLMLGMQNNQAVVGQRERLLALGSLSAGLTHELNNPAAAAVRATSALRERVAGMRHKLAMLASGEIDRTSLATLVKLQEHVVEGVAKAPKLSPIEEGDREDELAEWLDDHDIPGGWDVAPILAQGGIDVACLADIAESLPPEMAAGAVRWMGYSVETELLMGEIEDSVNRISNLVAATRQYSQMDRSPVQVVDIHDLLDSTLVMMAAKLEGITVHKDYDRSLPKVAVYAAELNQVWTNLIDNAAQAMAGQGTLTVCTGRENDAMLIEIGDTGTGIPADVQSRVFEPFFTTKPIGQGTGLGLDISWRIVVKRHRGDLTVESVPGDTRFKVRLPLTSTPVED